MVIVGDQGCMVVNDGKSSEAEMLNILKFS